MLTDEQIQVIECSRNLKQDEILKINAFAGTGKTFLISILRQELLNNWKNLRVAFACFTGKASSVLKMKLEENDSVFEEDFCGTIHSLIYRPEILYDKKLSLFIKDLYTLSSYFISY